MMTPRPATPVDSPPLNGRTRRTQQQRRAEAEQRVIEAAIELIAENGFAGLVLSDVAERAGYSRGLPAHYFGTRDGLAAEAARQIVARFAARVDERLRGVTGLTAILQFAGDYIDSAAHDPVRSQALLIVLTEATINSVLSTQIRELNQATLRRLAGAIRDGLAGGEIRADVSPEARAITILGMTRGMVSQWLADPAAVDIAAVRADLVAAVEQGLRP